ncbi:MAG: PASTA domain-containing protein [Armatimonadia bacterium]
MIPDVLGLPAEEARLRLTEAGLADVVEQWTAPPRGAIQGRARVVRQRLVEQQVHLVLSNFMLLEP